jgi:hypothetical protein
MVEPTDANADCTLSDHDLAVWNMAQDPSCVCATTNIFFLNIYIINNAFNNQQIYRGRTHGTKRRLSGKSEAKRVA